MTMLRRKSIGRQTKKRRVAQAAANGYQAYECFTSEADFPAELDRVYKITDGVLRTLIIAKDEVMEAARIANAEKAAAAKEAAAKAAAERAAAAEAKAKEEEAKAAEQAQVEEPAAEPAEETAAEEAQPEAEA